MLTGQEVDHLDFTVSRPLPNPAMQELNASAATRAEPTGDMARVAGRVIRGDNRKPLPFALVWLGTTGRADVGPTRTDAAGRFEFTAVRAGHYTLIVTAEGFVSPDPNGQKMSGVIIDLQDRQRLEIGDVILAPTRAIEGRILDEFGDPVPGVNVQPEQLVFIAGKSRLMPRGADLGHDTGPTDDQGWFRVYDLVPGDYYLVVAAGPFRASDSPASSASAGSIAGFAPTYFPGTANAAEAKPVHLDLSRDVIEVTFALATARMAVVSGRATDAAGQPVVLARIVLQQTVGNDIRALMAASATSLADGVFTYRDVPPGSYVLQAFAEGKFGTAFVTVPETENGGDDRRLVVRLHPLTTARGHVSFEYGASPPPRDQVDVRLLQTDFVSGPFGSNRLPSRIDDAWDFEIGSLAWSGVIRVNAPVGWALKRVAVDGRDITDTPYDFRSADVSGIEILLTNRTASVTGVVVDQDKPVPDCAVVVFSDDSAKWEFPSRFLFGARSAQQGTFAIRGLLPGPYLAAVLPKDVDLPAPTYLATLRASATSFVVAEGDTARVTLKKPR